MVDFLIKGVGLDREREAGRHKRDNLGRHVRDKPGIFKVTGDNLPAIDGPRSL